MKEMKRVFMNSHQSQLGDGDDATTRFKYESLLQDYLAVQKDFVSKKRKLQTVKQKKETLLAEVRFLRRRHRYLSKTQSQDPKLLNTCLSSKTPVEDKNHGAHEAVLKKQMLIPDSNHKSVGVAEDDGSSQQKVILRPPRPEKKLKNCLITGRREGKKTISWQDQVVSRVEFSETDL